MLRNEWGIGGCQIGQKKCYKGVRFNLITVIRGCVGVKFPGKKPLPTLRAPKGETCKL